MFNVYTSFLKSYVWHIHCLSWFSETSWNGSMQLPDTYSAQLNFVTQICQVLLLIYKTVLGAIGVLQGMVVWIRPVVYFDLFVHLIRVLMTTEFAPVAIKTKSTFRTNNMPVHRTVLKFLLYKVPYVLLFWTRRRSLSQWQYCQLLLNSFSLSLCRWSWVLVGHAPLYQVKYVTCSFSRFLKKVIKFITLGPTRKLHFL